MSKSALAIFFAAVFTLLIVAPTICIVIDDNIDVALLIDISEEEEEKGSEKHIEFELIVAQINPEISEFVKQNDNGQFKPVIKSYLPPHRSLFSPPPERNA